LRRHRQAGAGAHGKAHRADETGAGHHGTAKGRKWLGMDAENEYYTGVCKRDCEKGNYLCISTERRQRENLCRLKIYQKSLACDAA